MGPADNIRERRVLHGLTVALQRLRIETVSNVHPPRPKGRKKGLPKPGRPKENGAGVNRSAASG